MGLLLLLQVRLLGWHIITASELARRHLDPEAVAAVLEVAG